MDAAVILCCISCSIHPATSFCTRGLMDRGDKPRDDTGGLVIAAFIAAIHQDTYAAFPERWIHGLGPGTYCAICPGVRGQIVSINKPQSGD